MNSGMAASFSQEGDKCRGYRYLCEHRMASDVVHTCTECSVWNICLGTGQPLLRVGKPAWGELCNVC